MTAHQFYELKSEVREYFGTKFDAKKVLPKIGGKRPGKKCGGSYIAADKKCKSHYSGEGKLTEAGKTSAQELAGKVRARKGMEPLGAGKSHKESKYKDWRDIKLPDLKGSEKQVKWASDIRAKAVSSLFPAQQTIEQMASPFSTDRIGFGSKPGWHSSEDLQASFKLTESALSEDKPRQAKWWIDNRNNITAHVKASAQTLAIKSGKMPSLFGATISIPDAISYDYPELKKFISSKAGRDELKAKHRIQQ